MRISVNVSPGVAKHNLNKIQLVLSLQFSLAFALERNQSNSSSHLCDNVTGHIYFGGLEQ